MNEPQRSKQNGHCADMGRLASLRDGELAPEGREQLKAHLSVCPDCAADERSMAAGSQEVYGLLSSLAPASNEMPDTTRALAALQARLEEEGSSTPHTGPVTVVAWERPRRAAGSRRRYGWIIGAAAAVLIALLLIPNASVLADQFLSLFKVQQFQPVSVNPQNFRVDALPTLRDLGTVRTTSTGSHELQDVSEATAKSKVNFPILLPQHLPSGVGNTPHFTVLSATQGTFTFNSASARAYLNRTGQGTVAIPPQLDGATYTVTTTPGVVINYCQQTTGQMAEASKGESSPQSILARCGGTPFFVVEVPSPVIQATGKASLSDLRNFALSLPKLSPQERDIMQRIDLQSGIVPLPIPPNIDAQQVTAHGASGVVLVEPSMKIGAVVWQEHGIINMVATTTTDRALLVDISNSLH